MWPLPRFRELPTSPPEPTVKRRAVAPRPAPDPAAVSRRTLVVGRVLIACICLCLLAVGARVTQLQLAPDPRIADRANAQTSRYALPARRGSLLDRRGRVLAATRAGLTLFADPMLVEDPNTFPERVAYHFGYDPVDVAKAMSERWDSRYVRLDPLMSDERMARLDSIDLPGLATQRTLTREYPLGPLAGQVLGFVGTDGNGLEGMERVADDWLSGEPGQVRYHRDAQRRPLWVERTSYTPHRDGAGLRLSLDITIQSIAETQLLEAVTKYGAKSGQVVVMDTRTGEVLAMANVPAFAPTDLASSTPALRRNRCVTDVFEPGSTFKAIMWAVMTDARLADPDQNIDTTDAGFWRSNQGRRLRDTRGHGTITWQRVLVESSNIGMAIIGQDMPIRDMHAAVMRFGFGRPTGSGLPGEVGGIVRPASRWNHYSQTSIPMGQELAVTPLQIVRAFAAIANDGLMPQPSIIALPDHVSPIYERVISAPTAAVTRQALRLVVTEGTGRKANSKAYALFGKTGTAQMADHENGGYAQGKYVGSFIAAAPLERPRLAIGCFIQEPDPEIGYYGGLVAGPVVKHVMEQSLRYLGVPHSADNADSALAQR